MAPNPDQREELLIVPVTPDRWPDLERLFGPHGAYGNCWCMFWRQTRKQFNEQSGTQKKEGLREIVLNQRPPGLLAYSGSVPVGWCSLGPRQEFPALERSRTLKRVDSEPVWSIVCFYIARSRRKQGVMTALVRGAVAYARAQGAHRLEAYPTEVQHQAGSGQMLQGCSGYMGIASTLEKEGFIRVRRASATQWVMRIDLGPA